MFIYCLEVWMIIELLFGGCVYCCIGFYGGDMMVGIEKEFC